MVNHAPFQPLRIAVYGFVGEDHGSTSSAHYAVLAEFLRRGHQLDLFAIEDFVLPGNLSNHNSFRYFPYAHPTAIDLWNWHDRQNRFLRSAAGFPLSTVSTRLHYQRIARGIRRKHTQQPYDSLLVMGLLAPFRIPGLRAVSWPQGCPTGEAYWFARNPGLMVRHRAGHLLPAMAGVYSYKLMEARAWLKHSDTVLGLSEWTARTWANFGVPESLLGVLPYPIDLKRFRPAEPPAEKPPGEILFLHLGRLVPRKRLDLLLAGFAEYRKRDPEARLLIVGGFAYASGYRRLLSKPELMVNVEYREAVPRAEVLALLARADAVVQPSENENFGSAVAEGLACGRPALVGPTNGTKDYLPASSVVFAEYTPAALADGMAELAKRIRADREGIAADSRAAAERHFAVEVVADALERQLRN